MARAALNWSLTDLASAAGVHRNTISNFETGRFSGSGQALAAIRAALEDVGVEFIGETGVQVVPREEPEGDHELA